MQGGIGLLGLSVICLFVIGNCGPLLLVRE
jgi:hypothetical protein